MNFKTEWLLAFKDSSMKTFSSKTVSFTTDDCWKVLSVYVR